jgi:hypothetical protein
MIASAGISSRLFATMFESYPTAPTGIPAQKPVKPK